MIATVSMPRRVAVGASTRTAVPSVRPVFRVRALADNDKPADILHEQRDALKEAVQSSSDLKEARRKLYGNTQETSEDKTPVMDGAAEIGQTVLDKVSGRTHEGKGHNPYPKNPQPGSRLDEKGCEANTDKHLKQ